MQNDPNHHHDPFQSQFEKITGLNEWILWFLILGGGSAMILASLFLPDGLLGLSTPDVMYMIIWGMTAAALVRSFFDAKFLSDETVRASKQVKQLLEIDDIREFLDSSKNSIFRSHIDALYTIFQKNNEIRQDSLIELLHERLLARNRTVELFASTLITLGLIGTIIGLIMMVTKLEVALDDFKPENLDELIPMLFREGGALSGLSTAFNTTLLGAIFGGVVLRILTSVVEANITKYTAHVAELTEINVLPAMRSLATQLEKSGYYQRQ